jgi:hypothetical protein
MIALAFAALTLALPQQEPAPLDVMHISHRECVLSLGYVIRDSDMQRLVCILPGRRWCYVVIGR